MVVPIPIICYLYVEPYALILNYFLLCKSSIECLHICFCNAGITGTGITWTCNPIIAGRRGCSELFMALATYIYNDATDFEVDKINKTNRPSVREKLLRDNLS